MSFGYIAHGNKFEDPGFPFLWSSEQLQINNTFCSPKDYSFLNQDIHYMLFPVSVSHLQNAVNDMLREICNIPNQQNIDRKSVV